MKRNSKIPVNSSRSSLPGNLHNGSVANQKGNRNKTVSKKNQGENKITKGKTKSTGDKKTLNSAKTASTKQKYGIGNTTKSNGKGTNVQKDVNSNVTEYVSRIPRPTSRDSSPSPTPRLRRVSPIGGSKPIEESQEKPDLVVDDEEEFILLEKLCAEGEDINAMHGKVHSINDRACASDIVEQIFEEIFEPYEDTSGSPVVRDSQLGDNTDFIKEVSVVKGRSLPGTPYDKIGQVSVRQYSRNTSSWPDELNSENVNIKTDPPKKKSLTYEQNQRQRDNNVIGKTINTSLNEPQLDVIYMNSDTKSVTEKKSLHHNGITCQGTMTSRRIKEKGTTKDKVNHLLPESDVQEFDIEDRNSPVPSNSAFDFACKDSVSPQSETSEEQIAVSHDVDKYIDGKGLKEQSTTTSSNLKVIEDHYEMIELVEESSLGSESQIENRLPPSEVDLDRGTVECCISNELQFQEADQCTENGTQHSLGQFYNGFSGVYERDAFTPFIEREGHCLTDIEEENTADLAPSSSVASQVWKETEMEWEDDTLPLCSKRSSVEIMPFARGEDTSLEQGGYKGFQDPAALEQDCTENQGWITRSGYHTPDNSIGHTAGGKMLLLEQRTSTSVVSKSEKNKIAKFLTKGNVGEESLLDSQGMNSFPGGPTKPTDRSSHKNEKLLKKMEEGNRYDSVQVFETTLSAPLNLPSPQLTSAEVQKTGLPEKEIPEIAVSNSNFKAIGISPLRLQEKDCNDLKLSAKHLLSFGELNPITIDCVKLCRSKGLEKERRNSGDSGHFECDTPRREENLELKDVKEELEKMNVSIVGLQKELEDAREKVMKLRGGLALMRQSRLTWKKCIEGN